MNYKKFCKVTGLALAITGYAIMVKITAIGDGQGLCFATFFLWSLLSAISGVSMVRKGKSGSLSFAYASGSGLVAAVLIYKGCYNWSRMDTTMTVMVVGCLFVWWLKGDAYALVLSVLANCIASMSLVVKCWDTPESVPITALAAFLVANIATTVSSKDYTWVETLYPGSGIITTFFMVLPWLLYKI